MKDDKQVHACCGCSCDRCAQGHNTGLKHTSECVERFTSVWVPREPKEKR